MDANRFKKKKLVKKFRHIQRSFKCFLKLEGSQKIINQIIALIAFQKKKILNNGTLDQQIQYLKGNVKQSVKKSIKR